MAAFLSSEELRRPTGKIIPVPVFKVRERVLCSIDDAVRALDHKLKEYKKSGDNRALLYGASVPKWDDMAWSLE
ncbi:hypothetical protein [Burkholderia pseudomultivorans]|uniref:hypothetical protein n=1 Tax=Burkholderia pseudomultivorans TaxID=1207504 RepID=UPI000B23963C|nr:hypothetical protein [Burkholderia pseudomultivorans]